MKTTYTTITAISMAVIANQLTFTFAHTTCIEKSTDKFFFKTQENDPTKPIFYDCAALGTFKKKEGFCSNRESSWEDPDSGMITGPPREVCKITCGTCFESFHVSSAPPSYSPSTAPSSTSEVSCKDSFQRFKLTDGVYPLCKNVGTIIHTDEWCDMSPALVASHCPKACNKCQEYECKDSQATFLNKEGVEKTCDWLRSLDRRVIEKKCRFRVMAYTCRKTCGYCEGNYVRGKEYVIDFDETYVDTYVKYKRHDESGIYFYQTIAYQGEHYEKTDPALQKPAFSKANAGANERKGEYSEFFCPGGSFDLLSILITPLWDFKAGKADSVTIKAYDDSGSYDYVGEYFIKFNHASEVAKIDFSHKEFTFNNLGAVIIDSPKFYHGYDDIKIVLNTACTGDDYGSKWKHLEHRGRASPHDDAGTDD